MKLLFLDIDGVLNSTQSSQYFWKFHFNQKLFVNTWATLDPIAMSNLDYLLETLPDLRVVISSDWRKYHPISDFEKNMSFACPNIKGRVIGMTPVQGMRMDTQRGLEIEAWRKANNLTDVPFVALDDGDDFQNMAQNWIHVDPRTGLTWVNVQDVITKFMASEST